MRRRISKAHNYQYWTEDCGGGGVGDGPQGDGEDVPLTVDVEEWSTTVVSN